MNGEELALFRQSLHSTIESHNGAALDAALSELGWPDALAADARAAVPALFELQGAANATSCALSWVLAHALAHEAAAVVLPVPGTWSAPGLFEGGRLRSQYRAATAELDAATASYNTAVGGQALYANTSGAFNTALGRYALAANTTGSANVATGDEALDAMSTGSSDSRVVAS